MSRLVVILSNKARYFPSNFTSNYTTFQSQRCIVKNASTTATQHVERIQKTSTGSTDSDSPHKNHKKYLRLDLSFSNYAEAFKSKSTWEIYRAIFILKMCSFQYIVTNNAALMKFGKKILGDRLFTLLMKKTFFGQFVAGENEKDIKFVVDHLRKFGVKSILDYSAEEDITSEQAEKIEMTSFNSDKKDVSSVSNSDTKKFQAHREFADRRKDVITARTYFYMNEAQCEKNMETFLKCIDAVSDTTNSSGFAAIKVTALGRPKLLMQLSEVIARTRNYFQELSGQSSPRVHSSLIKRREFEKFLEELKVSTDRQDVKKWLEQMDYDKRGLVHIFSWSGLVDMNYLLSDVFKVPNLQTGRMESLITALTAEEEEMFKNMMRRLHTISQRAREKGVRVMIDAEQSYLQPAISRITMELMRKYNKKRSIIFNTYQCYLKEAYDCLIWDLDLAKRQEIYFGAKLVRGAYMDQERARAMSVEYEDPINPTYESTNEMYQKTLSECLKRIREANCDEKLAVMVASHNEETVRYTSAECERVFSNMKLVKSDWRSVLKSKNLSDQLMIILATNDIDPYDPLPAIRLWKSAGSKPRRPCTAPYGVRSCNADLESDNECNSELSDYDDDEIDI
ncbi:Proline dehydrogenase 1, mitochondrial [Nymphon striatum]|nr:Proline dehydrogenase 1, mitochondrial [Nymphon striatum]